MADFDYPIMIIPSTGVHVRICYFAESEVSKSAIRKIMCHVIRCPTPSLDSRHLIRTHSICNLQACLNRYWCYLHQFDAANLHHSFNRVVPSLAYLAKVSCRSSIFLRLLLLHKQPCEDQNGGPNIRSRGSSHLNINGTSVNCLGYAKSIPTFL